MTQQIIHFIVDAARERVLTTDGYAFGTQYYNHNSDVQLRITVYEDYNLGTLMDLSTASMLWGIDNTYVTLHPDMVSATSFSNQASDWALVAPSAGKICTVISMSTDALSAWMGESASKIGYQNLWITNVDGDSAVNTLLLGNNVVVVNNITQVSGI